MIKYRNLVFALVTIFVSGCATVLKPEDIAKLDYGPFPENYESTVKDYFNDKLRDPFSAQYSFRKPFKGYLRSAPITGGKVRQPGWVVVVSINAKNGFGGYSGWKIHRLLMRDNKVVEEFGGNMHFSEPWLKQDIELADLPVE